MLMNTIPVYAPLDDVKKEIWEGDLLVFRNRNGSCYRVAKAAWWEDELFCLEVRRFQGVVAVPLKQVVSQFSGKIDVYEVNPENYWANYDRKSANRYLKNITFSKSDRRGAVLEALLNLRLRLFGTKKINTAGAPYSAEAIRLADRLGGGVDPLPDRVNVGIEPCDLKTSSLYRYRFTLR